LSTLYETEKTFVISAEQNIDGIAFNGY